MKSRAVFLFSLLATLLVSGCALKPPPVSDGHLGAPQAGKLLEGAEIPAPVRAVPLLPPPQDVQEDEVYTVVVNRVPVDDLLFSLARDAKMNVDIYPGIQGEVTINAIDQTLPQILDRLSNQVDMRYEIRGNTLIILPDRPYPHTYRVDYLNMDRASEATVAVATQISSVGVSGDEMGQSGGGSTGSGGDNNSTSRVLGQSRYRFWYTLVRNILGILGDTEALEEEGDDNNDSLSGDLPITAEVIPHPEAGLITVVATQRQHREIAKLIERVQESAQRQVLVEATVVEVDLSYNYQTGVDWSRIASEGGFTFMQNMIGQNLSDTPFFLVNYANDDSAVGNISASVKMLEQFGDVKILSSPKAMVLNNQTAVLKVVDNKVYFTMSAETNQNQVGSLTTFTTTLHTVPVGFVMTVTPQISDADTVIMNVRPTVSRIVGYVKDPNPVLARENVESKIPEIQVREIESILKVHSGQIAILGGLMQDSKDNNRSGIPGLSRTPIADAFGFRDDKFGKTELVIFLKPTVVHQASLEGDLKDYGRFLEEARKNERRIP